MALDTQTEIAPYDAPEKDLYEIGEMPPLGHVPKQMYAGRSGASGMASPTSRCWSRWWTRPRSTATRFWCW